MRWTVILVAGACLKAQDPLPPDLATLAKIRTRMIFNLEHQPNYTCVETIERSSRPKTTNKLKIVDTLRLEVALVDGREMFAWPGSKKFEEFDVTKMVPTGAIGNGNFAIHARALFATHAATFHYLGEVDFQGKKALRFDYNVSQIASGYRIRVRDASAIVAYRGSFYADPQTFDMEELQVIAEQLPPELNLRAAEDKIAYAIARIGEGDFLLPSGSDLTMVDVYGGENHNHVKFTACRQFSGESVITFDEAPASKPESAPVQSREFEMPTGLDVELLMTQELDLHTAAIGDPIEVRVNRDVRQKGQLLIPKGATSTGRITRIEKYETYSIVGVAFPEIEAPGIVAHMKGSLDRTLGVQAVHGRFSMRGRTPQQPGEGVFPVNDTQRRLARGCIMIWRT